MFIFTTCHQGLVGIVLLACFGIGSFQCRLKLGRKIALFDMNEIAQFFPFEGIAVTNPQQLLGAFVGRNNLPFLVSRNHCIRETAQDIPLHLLLLLHGGKQLGILQGNPSLNIECLHELLVAAVKTGFPDFRSLGPIFRIVSREIPLLALVQQLCHTNQFFIGIEDGHAEQTAGTIP